MDFSELELRKKISDVAVTLFITDRSRFSIRNIAAAAEVSTDEVYAFYSTKDEILSDFYNIIPLLCNDQISKIDGYEDLKLADRLSNFMYTTFDLLQEQSAFVEKTFEKWHCSDRCQPWRNRTAEHFRDILDLDPRVSDLNRVIIPEFGYKIASNLYMQLVHFWLQDSSDGSEKTLALVEKSMVFIQEVFYADILSKGFDLGRYLYSHVLPDHPMVKKLKNYYRNCTS